MTRRPKSPLDDDAPPAIGDNFPPEPLDNPLGRTPEEWFTAMQEAFAEALTKQEALLARDANFKTKFPLSRPVSADSDPPGIERWTSDIVQIAADYRQELLDVLKLADNLHGIQKAPILIAQRAVDGFHRNFVNKLAAYDSKRRLLPGADAPLNRVRDRLTIYHLHQEALVRREAEADAERLRKEAAEIAATAAQTMEPEHLDKAADAFGVASAAADYAAGPLHRATRVTSDFGNSTGLTARWVFVEAESRLADLVAAAAQDPVLLVYLQFNTTRLGYAVRSEDVREVPGCVIREEKRA